MNTKHTPGPWKYAHGSADLLVHDGDDVAYVDTLIPERSKQEQEANARLIAAAPELLAALNEIMISPNSPAAKQRAFEAIAKATNTR